MNMHLKPSHLMKCVCSCRTPTRDHFLGPKYAANRKSTGQLNLNSGGLFHYVHTRSNSLRASLISERNIDRRRSNTLDVADRLAGSHGNLARTRSLSALGAGGGPGVETIPSVDPSNLMATVFWIAASLLESDYEFEYLLALRLLNKLLGHLPLDRVDSREHLEKVLAKLKWYSFPGLLQLFLKGFTSASTQELTIHLLSKLITVSKHTLIDPSQMAGQSVSPKWVPYFFSWWLITADIKSICISMYRKYTFAFD